MEEIGCARDGHRGVYGFVLTFCTDSRIALVHQAAQQPFYRNGVIDTNRYARFMVREPHLTLFHAPLQTDPSRDPGVRQVLVQLRGLLFPAESPLCVQLRHLQVFGERYLWWNAEPTAPTYPLLCAAHAMAVLALAGHLDVHAIVPASREGLKLTERQRDNLTRYGHPLVGIDAQPHVTLAWDPEIVNHGALSARRGIAPWERTCGLSAKAVHLAEMGDYGAIKQILL